MCCLLPTIHCLLPTDLIMVEALKRLKKLKGRSLDELCVRGAQALAASAERNNLSPEAREPSDSTLFKLLDAAHLKRGSSLAESLLEHFRARTSPCFFAAFADPDATVAELRRRFGPHVEAAVIERADRIGEGRFDLLGLRDIHFGQPIDWHLEPVSGKRAPLVHWSRIDYLNADVAGDKKIIWELNRHQYFATLGRAYWYTRDERYARTFITHISGWMNHNPPKLGINWASSLEVAFRAISWLWALHFFKNSPHLTPPVFLRMLKFLYLHARHLEAYPSTYFSPNTHLTGEALGLFYLGTVLPEFRRATRWRATATRILISELHRHVRPDGVYFEQSSYYHRYTVDFYTHLLILSQANGTPLEGELEKRLRALLDHLMYITRPDGTTPFYGDDDGGRLVMLDERAPNDFRAALSTGAALFNRADYKYVAGEAAEETIWLLGPEGGRAFDRLYAHPPAQLSRAFTGGGYYVMRDAWTQHANYLLIDCGPHGALNYGHAHADALAFDLTACGRTLLVDPGTYTYTGSAKMRDQFRASAAHNALTVDGESSSVPDGPFKWRHIAHARTRAWTSHERFDFFEGDHDGYMRLTAPATHVRSVLFLKGDYWIVRDRVEATGAHHYDLHFHFTADADPTVETEEGVAAIRERRADSPGLEIFTFGCEGEWRREDGLVSHIYGACSTAPVCIFSATAEGANDFITFLVPRRVQALKTRTREIEARCGRAFEVHDSNKHDVLLIGDGRFVETARFASDFEWTWARFTCDAAEPDEFVLINGRQLRFDGQEILNTAKRVPYVVARRQKQSGVWSLESGVQSSLSDSRL